MKNYGINMEGDLKIKSVPSRPLDLGEGNLLYIEDEEGLIVGGSGDTVKDVGGGMNIFQQDGAPTLMAQDYKYCYT